AEGQLPGAGLRQPVLRGGERVGGGDHPHLPATGRRGADRVRPAGSSVGSACPDPTHWAQRSGPLREREEVQTLLRRAGVRAATKLSHRVPAAKRLSSTSFICRELAAFAGRGTPVIRAKSVRVAVRC